MSTESRLRSRGLLNTDAPSFGDLASQENRKSNNRGTYCSSASCVRAYYGNQYGKLVHVGNTYLKECPKCGGRTLLFKQCTESEIARFERSK